MKYQDSFKINDRRIANDAPTYFIADIAANHDNNLNKAKELIWLAKEAGADAAKFQHFTASTIVSDYGFKSLGSKMSHQSKWEKSVFETYEDASLNINWTDELVKTCKEAEIDFFTSPYSVSLVDKIDQYVPAFKIGSGDITYTEIIEHIAQKDKPVLLATGASDMKDVKRAVEVIIKHNPAIAIMQCNTNYTAQKENFKYINLNVLKSFQELYPGMVTGLSDHTFGHATVLGAIALGARLIEKHFTDDNNRKGPDHAFSMNPVTWKEMVDRSRELELAMGNGQKVVEANELESVVLQRRCLRTTRDLPKGHVLSKTDLESLRPAPESSYLPYELEELIGKPLKINKKKGDAIIKGEI